MAPITQRERSRPPTPAKSIIFYFYPPNFSSALSNQLIKTSHKEQEDRQLRSHIGTYIPAISSEGLGELGHWDRVDDFIFVLADLRVDGLGFNMDGREEEAQTAGFLMDQAA